MINLSYNGKAFSQREDGFVNLGQLCATHGKAFKDWKKTNQAQAYLTALAETLTESDGRIITTDELVVSETTAIGGKAATWGHPLVAVEVARWIAPAFGVWCNQHIKTLIETGQTQIEAVTEIYQPLERIKPVHTSVEYANAANQVSQLPDGILKQLIQDALVDELSLQQNLKFLPVAEKPKQYTIVKVRAKMLGYTDAQIGNGKALGKFVKSQIEPAFQEMIGRFPVFHYEVCDRLDDAIHHFFS